MKKVIIANLFIAIALVLSSCGANSIEGNWKVDPTSLDLVLGEGFPTEMKQGVEEAMSEAKSNESKEEAEKITLELLKDGKAVLTHADEPGDNLEFLWAKKGKILNFNGEIEGEKFDVNLDIMESSDTEIKIGFTGESILKQLKDQRPDLIEQIPGLFDLDKLVKGASISVKMAKA